MKKLLSSLSLLGLLSSLSFAEWLAEENVSRDEFQWAYTSYNNARCVAVDTAGVIYVVWHSGDAVKGNKASPIYCCERTDTWWGEPYEVSSFGGTFPCIATDRINNKIHMIFSYGPWEEYIYYSVKTESGWSTPLQITDTTESLVSSYPSLAVEPSTGNVHIVWQGWVRADDNYEIFYKYKDSLGWHPDERLTQDSADSRRPSVAVDTNKCVHITWTDERDGDIRVYYKRKEGVMWTTDTILPATDSASGAPFIVKGFDEKVYVAWGDYRTGVAEIYFKERNNEIWSSDYQVTFGDNLWGGPSIDVDIVGNIHICWIDARDGHCCVYYKMRDTIGNWSADFQVSANSYPYDGYVQTTGADVSLTTDKSGNVYIVWSVRYPQDFPFTTYSDVYFRMKEADSVGVEERQETRDKRQETELEIQPNPFIRTTAIKLLSNQAIKGKVQVYDMVGRLVEETESKVIGKDLSPGVYFVKLREYKPIKIVKLR